MYALHQSPKFQGKKRTFNENNTRTFTGTGIVMYYKKHTRTHTNKHCLFPFYYITISSLLLLWLEWLVDWLGGWVMVAFVCVCVHVPSMVFWIHRENRILMCFFFFFCKKLFSPTFERARSRSFSLLLFVLFVLSALKHAQFIDVENAKQHSTLCALFKCICTCIMYMDVPHIFLTFCALLEAYRND